MVKTLSKGVVSSLNRSLCMFRTKTTDMRYRFATLFAYVGYK